MNPDVEDAPAEGESAIERDLRGGAGLAVAPAPESPLPEVLWYGIVTTDGGDNTVCEFLGIDKANVKDSTENCWRDIPSQRDCENCDGRGVWNEDCHDCGRSIEQHCCSCSGTGQVEQDEQFHVECITLTDAKERFPAHMADVHTVARLMDGEVIEIAG